MYGETAYASDMQLVEFVLCGLLSGIGDIDIPPVDAINSLLAFAIQCDGFFDEALRELIAGPAAQLMAWNDERVARGGSL